jgi:hypothetical protein
MLIRAGQDSLAQAQGMDIYDEDLLREMMEYQRVARSQGNFGYSAPAGKHDDLIMADLLCLIYLEELPAFKPKMNKVVDTIWTVLNDQKNKDSFVESNVPTNWKAW